MENNKLFITINRINSVLFLLLLLGGLASLIYMFYEINRHDSRTAVAITKPDSRTKETIELSDVVNIEDKNIQYVKVYSRDGGVLGSGGYSKTLRNLLFLDPKGENPDWLLPDNTTEILKHRILSKYNKKTSTRRSDYLYLEFKQAPESLKVCISNLKGTSINCLEQNLNKVLQHHYYADSQTLALLLQTNNEIRYKTYNLKSNDLISDKFVIGL